jgi:uncharacterized protein
MSPSHGSAFTDRPVVLHAAQIPDADLELEPLDPKRITAGPAEVRHYCAVRTPDLNIGIWQHGQGTSTDVETDEAFVVLSGNASIQVEEGPLLEVGPGDLVLLPAGARTTWTVHAPLRKVYVVRP